MEQDDIDTENIAAAGTTRRQCPRCGKWFTWWQEYADHAWNEKP